MKKDIQKLQRMAFKPLLIFLIFHIITVSITHAQPQPYSPDDNIVLDCGSSKNNKAADGRRWNGDIKNKYFPLDHGQNKASITSNAVESSNAQVEDVPYETARLSLSEFSYTIPVTPGPKFIRLYFYAANYQNFDRSKAFFSVKTGQYTLLNNFSTSLTADFLQQQDMMREFCVTVEESILNITFTPTSSISEAFAFINGIEVVSMPANLSYPDPQSDIGQGIKFVGQENLYPLENNTALETAYRINIGGAFCWIINLIHTIDPAHFLGCLEAAETILVSKLASMSWQKRSLEKVLCWQQLKMKVVDEGYVYGR